MRAKIVRICVDWLTNLIMFLSFLRTIYIYIDTLVRVLVLALSSPLPLSLSLFLFNFDIKSYSNYSVQQQSNQVFKKSNKLILLN